MKLSRFCIMVEVGGIEPPSQSLATAVSPYKVSCLISPVIRQDTG